MPRRFVKELCERETVDDVFLASDKQLRTNKNGNFYLMLKLSDRSGTITGMMWNGCEEAYRTFDNGDYVQIEGATQNYNGALQMVVNHITRTDAREVRAEDFLQHAAADVDRMGARVAEMLRALKNFHLRNLAECYLMDEAFMERFSTAPAGVKNHHAYQGGLLEHVHNLMEVVQAVAPRYPQMDGEVLLCGAFLHDLGKIDELHYERDRGYTDEGQLIGHVVMGVVTLEQKIREAEKLSGEPFPPELAMHLKHMVVSHHGEYEFGSPKLPMTLEAIALHHLDNLDAKLHSFAQLMAEDANIDSPWTTYHPNIGRKLHKGNRS
jgi:3'-5' exoribonuclease